MSLTIQNTKSIFNNFLYTNNRAESTAKAYLLDLNHFNEFLKVGLNNKIRTVDKITKVEIMQYKMYLTNLVKTKKISNQTALRRFNSLKVYFNFLEEYYNIPNIIKKDSWGNKKNLFCIDNQITPGILSKDDINILFQTIEKSTDKNKYRDIAIFEVLLSTGCRRSEILEMRWEDLNFYNGTIFIRRQKTKNYNRIKLSNSALIALKNYFNVCENRTNFIFKSKYGNKISKSAFNEIIKKWINKSKINNSKPFNITAHTFRHTFITLCLKNNIEASKIIDYTGHRDISSIEFYKHLIPNDYTEIINSIDNIRNSNYNKTQLLAI